MKTERIVSALQKFSSREVVKFLATTVAVGVLAPALLYYFAYGATAQEIPTTPTPITIGTPEAPPPTEIQASNIEEESISGGIPWPAEWPNLALRITLFGKDTDGNMYDIFATGAVAYTSTGQKVLITCHHCLTTDDQITLIESGTVSNLHGKEATINSFTIDNSVEVYAGDARVAGELSSYDLVDPVELDYSALNRVENGKSLRVIFLAYDPNPNQNRFEYIRGRLHRNIDDFQCVVPPNSATDHLCFTPDNLETIIQGNSGGIFFLEDVFDSSKIARIVAVTRSQYIQLALSEAWFKGLRGVGCSTFNAPPHYHCVSYPLGSPTPTRTPPGGTPRPLFPTQVPSSTPNPGVPPTATFTATPTLDRPDATRTPHATPTYYYAHQSHLPLVVQNARNAIVIPAAAE